MDTFYTFQETPEAPVIRTNTASKLYQAIMARLNIIPREKPRSAAASDAEEIDVVDATIAVDAGFAVPGAKRAMASGAPKRPRTNASDADADADADAEETDADDADLTVPRAKRGHPPKRPRTTASDADAEDTGADDANFTVPRARGRLPNTPKIPAQALHPQRPMTDGSADQVQRVMAAALRAHAASAEALACLLDAQN
jgi:hypothetical protein